MSKKHLRDIAIVVIVIFVITVIVYPLLFGTDAKPNASAPVELPGKNKNAAPVAPTTPMPAEAPGQ